MAVIMMQLMGGGIMWEKGFGDKSGAPGMAKRKYHVLIYESIVE